MKFPVIVVYCSAGVCVPITRGWSGSAAHARGALCPFGTGPRLAPRLRHITGVIEHGGSIRGLRARSGDGIDVLSSSQVVATAHEAVAVAVLGEYVLIVEQRVTAANTEASFEAVAAVWKR
ncbi:hypothetical protein ON010_g16171 [Phytophthora cinnamomi]|nr:hypothetical protein ON010_g16171 [Phytophthora cinnamomi]